MAEKENNTEMKTLGNLSPAPGSNHRRKRKGRGMGSGLGKTAGRGNKGQRARKSGNVRPGFEGGQQPLYLRVPKRGFTNHFRKEYNIVNLENLDRFDAGAQVTPDALRDKGLIRDLERPTKLLGNGELAKKLEIHVHKASASAKAAVEKAGGSLQILDEKKAPKKA